MLSPDENGREEIGHHGKDCQPGRATTTRIVAVPLEEEDGQTIGGQPASQEDQE